MGLQPVGDRRTQIAEQRRVRGVGRRRREARLQIVRALARRAALGEEVVAQPAGQVGDLAGIGGMPGREHAPAAGPASRRNFPVSGPVARKRARRPSGPPKMCSSRATASAAARSPEVAAGRAGQEPIERPDTATSRRSSRRVRALAQPRPRRAARSSSATSASTALCARPMRSVRSSASSTSRGVSVSSATRSRDRRRPRAGTRRAATGRTRRWC